MPDLAIDLHGERPDRGRINYLLVEAIARARASGLGLRIIHGRGAGVMAGLVHSLLEERGLPCAASWANPGETRLDAATLRRKPRW